MTLVWAYVVCALVVSAVILVCLMGWKWLHS